MKQKPKDPKKMNDVELILAYRRLWENAAKKAWRKHRKKQKKATPAIRLEILEG